VGAKLAKALGRCALSITYTTLTDVAAFGLGCLGTIPAVRYFCAYAAVAVAFDFVYQVTFFLAVFAIDERRTNGGGCCCGANCGSPSLGASLGASVSTGEANAEAPGAEVAVLPSAALTNKKRTRELADR
jgi:hypothetical protein